MKIFIYRETLGEVFFFLVSSLEYIIGCNMVNTNRFFLVFIFIFCLNLLLNAIYLFQENK